MEWMDYREKLGLGFNDEGKYRLFLVRVFNALNCCHYTEYGATTVDAYSDFCNTVGLNIDYSLFEHGNADRRYQFCLNALERHSSCLNEFLAYYAAFMNSVEETGVSLTRETLKNVLLNALDAAHLPYDLFAENGEYFIFPQGVKEFDNALVSDPLIWLSAYPKTEKTYIAALKQYSDGMYIRDVADNLRKTLESFLQEFLGNNKNLETNKSEICRYLGEQGVDAGISGLFQPLINSYKNINDRIAKHNDKVDEKLLEFLLYQTGILIRMILVVQGAETEADSDAD